MIEIARQSEGAEDAAGQDDGGQEGDGPQVHEFARVDPKGTTPDVRVS
jgi:hypothetical protein